MEVQTQASGGDALSNLVAEGLVEGDVAFLEHAVEELRVRSASATTKMQQRWQWRCTYNRVKLSSPLDDHGEDEVADLQGCQHACDQAEVLDLPLLVALVKWIEMREAGQKKGLSKTRLDDCW